MTAPSSRLRLQRAADALLTGGVIAYPTEGVYGLGCLPANRAAVERILTIKRRPIDKGLLLIAAEAGQLEPLIEWPSGALGRELRGSWPGPVTWVLEAAPRVPGWLTGGRGTLAVRVTSHPLAAELCRRVGPLVSTSANRAGRRPIRDLLRLRRQLGRDVDYVLAGPLGAAAGPSEIRDGRSGAILRPAS